MSEDALRTPLSVVIPAFNEARRLGATLRRITEYFRSCSMAPEIVLVDDGSRDGTAGVGREFLSLYEGPGLLLVNHRNCGKGYSARRGVLASSGDRLLICDADLSVPIEEVHALLEIQEREHLAMVAGSRALPASRIEVHQSPLREMLGKCFNLAVRLLSGLPFHDTQCGFKLLERDAALPLVRDLQVNGFAFDVELLWLACRAGVKVGEHPVRWRNSPGTHVGLLSAAPRMLWDLLILRRRFGRLTEAQRLAVARSGEGRGEEGSRETPAAQERDQERAAAGEGSRGERGRRWSRGWHGHRKRRRKGGRW